MERVSPKYMNAKIDLDKTYNLRNTYDVGIANFGYIKKSGNTEIISWGSCRDSFQITPNKELENGFFFSHKNTSYDNAAFITKVENLLGLENSVFSLTTVASVTFVKASPWWFSMPIRKSFFSMMIKCALSYNRETDNFENALYSSIYSKETKEAIQKFLNGYTSYEFKPSNDCDHWFTQFATYINNSKYVINKQNLSKLKPGKELISKKAFELWLQNRDSDEKENWLKAEQQLLKEAC